MKALDYLTQEELVSLAKMALAKRSLPNGIQDVARLASKAIPRHSVSISNTPKPPRRRPGPKPQPKPTESPKEAKAHCRTILYANCPRNILESRSRSAHHHFLRSQAILAAKLAGFHPEIISNASTIPVRRIYSYLSQQNPA